MRSPLSRWVLLALPSSPQRYPANIHSCPSSTVFKTNSIYRFFLLAGIHLKSWILEEIAQMDFEGELHTTWKHGKLSNAVYGTFVSYYHHLWPYTHQTFIFWTHRRWWQSLQSHRFCPQALLRLKFADPDVFFDYTTTLTVIWTAHFRQRGKFTFWSFHRQ